MIIDLTLSKTARRAKEIARWKKFFFNCPDLEFVPNLIEILASVGDAYERLVAEYGNPETSS
jgi:hypothetical protein